MPGLEVDVTYWEAQQSRRVTTLDTQVIIDNEELFPGRVARAQPTPEDVLNGVPGAITAVDQTFLNFGDLEVRGFDFHARFDRDTRAGHFAPYVSATEIHHYVAAITPGAPSTDRVDQGTDDGTWAPKWKLSAGLNWKQGPVSAGVSSRYTSRYRDYDGAPRKLGGDWFFDCNFRFELAELTQRASAWLGRSYLQVGAINIANKHAPYSNYQQGGLGYDPAQYDIRGRVFYFQGGLEW